MASLASGGVFGDYRVEGVLATGGMAVVYRATRERTGQAIALKVIRPTLASFPAYRDRFRREAAVLVGLRHPRIVPLIDFGEHEGTLYLALAYLDGPNLQVIIEGEGPLSIKRTVGLLDPVAEGLDAAHRRGYVHRDIKPANIMLDSDGNVYLTDFGLGKLASSNALSTTGLAVGTPSYMSPEQFDPKLADPSIPGRTDIYALGCVLFACLTSREVVPTHDISAAMYAHLHEPPPRLADVRPGLPSALDDILAKAMAKRPADRYATAKELIDDLKVVAATQPEPAAPMPVPARQSARRSVTDVLGGLTQSMDQRVVDPSTDGEAGSRVGTRPAGRELIVPQWLRIGATGFGLVAAALISLVGVVLVLRWLLSA